MTTELQYQPGLGSVGTAEKTAVFTFENPTSSKICFSQVTLGLNPVDNTAAQGAIALMMGIVKKFLPNLQEKHPDYHAKLMDSKRFTVSFEVLENGEKFSVRIFNGEKIDIIQPLSDKTGQKLKNSLAKAVSLPKTSSSVLTQHDMTVLEETAHHLGASEKTHTVFAEISEKIEALEIPAEGAILGFEWATAIVEVVSHHAHHITEGLEKGAGAFGLFGLIAKANKIIETFFKAKAEGAEGSNPSIFISMAFSIAECLCSAVSWLSKVGIISHAISTVWRLNLIGASINLALAVIDLGNNIIHYTSAAKLLKALFYTVIYITTAALIVYAVAHLNVLLLMLGTGILILNVAIPDEEEHEVKEVH